MTGASPRRNRHHRPLLVVAMMLAVSATGLWLLVWSKVQRNDRDTWVSAIDRLGVAAEVAVDGADRSVLGLFRSWFGMPRTHVYLWEDAEAALLLRAPIGAPSGVLIQIEGHVSKDVIQRLAVRFPTAEFRRRAGGLGGGGLGYF